MLRFRATPESLQPVRWPTLVRARRAHAGSGLARHFAPPDSSGGDTSAPLFPTDKSVEQGAATQVYLATSPEVLGLSGVYFKDCAPARTRKSADDVGLAQRLWVESERIVSRL